MKLFLTVAFSQEDGGQIELQRSVTLSGLATVEREHAQYALTLNNYCVHNCQVVPKGKTTINNVSRVHTFVLTSVILTSFRFSVTSA